MATNISPTPSWFLLRPAISLMQRLRLLPKFILLCLVVLLPLLLLTALLMGELHKSIASDERERTGVAYLRQVHELTRLAQQQRGAQYLRLSTRAAPGAAATALSARLDALDSWQAQAPGLQGLAEWQDVQRQWQALAAPQAAQSAREQFARHSAFIAALAKLGAAVTERAWLRLDQDPAGDALVSAFGATLPELAERLSDIGGHGAAVIDTGLFEGNDEQLLIANTMIARHGLQRAQAEFAALLARQPQLQARLGDKLGALARALDALELTRDQVINSNNGATSGKAYLHTLDSAVDGLHGLAGSAAAALDAMLAERAALAIAHRNLVLAGIVATLALAAWLFIGFYVSFSGDIVRLDRAVRRAAGGDLSTRLASQASDEIGGLVNAFDGMAGGLVALVTDIRAGAATIGAVTENIAEGNADLSEHTATQARALADTMASMRVLSATVTRSAAHAGQGRQLMLAASNVAERGASAVSDVVATMATIRSSSHKIADIVGVIDAIAFQTNILALNAAVEAARAGDQGRGFAVVAGEVRTLAQRAAAAAREIKDLIGTSVATVDAGNALVTSAGATIGQLVASVRQVESLIGQVASAGQAQQSELGQLERAIASIGAMTRQNGELVRTASEGSARLHQETGQLSLAVSMFKLATRPKTPVLAHFPQ